MLFTNSSFNSTDENNDPVVKFLYAITSKTAEQYATTAVCVILFITCGLPTIGPVLFLAINYGVALVIFKIHCLKYRLRHGKAGIDEDAARQAIWAWWTWVSKIWFGHEMIGLEAVPPDQPVIFIALHGVVPATVGSIHAILAKYRQHPPYVVADRHHVKHPTLKNFLALFNFGGWSREECVKILQDGNDLAISPGGSLDVKYSDSNYTINWGNRKGFANVAIDAKATIVPMCILNLNEAFWTPYIIQKFMQSKFAPKGVAFGCGGLPVKLTTIVGAPIPYDESKTVDDVIDNTLNAMKQLLAANQRIPGNKFCALLDRFRTIKPKLNNVATIQV